MRNFLSLLFVGFLSLSGISTSLAATPEQMQKAADLFDVAEKNYKVGDYEKALDGYKEAYVLSGEADLLFNIAQCQRKLGRNEEALRTYKNFLAERPDTPIKPDVEKIIAELEAAPPPTQDTSNAPPLYFHGEKSSFAVGGGLSLLGPFPELSAVANFGVIEAQARFGGLNFLTGGIDVGAHIMTAPPADKSVRSLLNISAGVSFVPSFNRFDTGTGFQKNTSLSAGIYGANSFYITCKFSVRSELGLFSPFFVRNVIPDPIDPTITTVNQGLPDQFDLGLALNAFAHYTINRDACPK